MYQGSLLGVPYSDCLVVTCAVDQTFSSPAHTTDAALVSGQDVLRLARVDNPYSDCCVLASTGKTWCTVSPEVIRLPNHIGNPFCVTSQGVSNSLSSVGVPKTNCLVETSSSESRTVGGPSDC